MMTEQISGSFATLEEARKTLARITRRRKYIDPALLPQWKQFHKLSPNVMLINETKKVFFCPGISRNESVDGYNGVWQQHSLNKTLVRFTDLSQHGDYWKSCQLAFRFRMTELEEIKADLLEKGNDSIHCLKPYHDIKSRKSICEISMPESTGLTKSTIIRACGENRNRIDSLILDACISRCVTYIVMMEATLELLKKPKENLRDYSDWLAGAPII